MGGDISYADDYFLHDPTGFGYESVYNSWMNWIQNMSSTKPYMVLPGNHETECHSPACLTSSELRNSLKNFSAFNVRWHMPYAESHSRSNMWYSFDYGNAHFISVNTETDFPGAEQQVPNIAAHELPAGHFGADGEYLAWLENDLKMAVANRKERPWIIAGGHRPIYTAVAQKNYTGPLESLLHKYGVDLYVSGHVHSYARSFSVYDGNVVQKTNTSDDHYFNPTDPVYAVVGGAGCDEMKPGIVQQLANWTAAADDSYGTATITFANRTSLHFEYISSKTLKVKDHFWLIKNH